MFDRKNIKRYYLNSVRKIRSFLLSAKSRELLVFCFFVCVEFCFWLLHTINDIYQADFKIPVRLKNVPKEIVMTSELPKEIRVHVEDRGTVLLNYMLGRTFFPVSFDSRIIRITVFTCPYPYLKLQRRFPPSLPAQPSLCLCALMHLSLLIQKEMPRKFRWLPKEG